MYEVKVTGMSCGSCASSIDHVVKSKDPNAEVSVDLRTQTVRIRTKERQDAITALIEAAGYPVVEAKRVG